MNTLTLINQNTLNDPLGCGIACLAMIASCKGNKPLYNYRIIKKSLFPEGTSKEHNGNPDFRTKINQLKGQLNLLKIDNKSTTLNKTAFTKNPINLVMIMSNEVQHWILIFNYKNKLHVADPELHKFETYTKYFSKGCRKLIENTQYIAIKEIKINELAK